MPNQSDDLPEPLAEFVDELVRLRESAGNPSFRRMAERSGAVSHATLHQAVAGHRLQPWETVREFVRACGGDEDAVHERWLRTQQALAAADGDGSGETAGSTGTPPWWRRRRPATVFAVAASVVAAAVAATVTFTLVDRTPATTADQASGTPAASGTEAAATLPVVPGDAAMFLRDVTYADGTVVETGQVFTKVWEFQNVGTVRWHDRYLQRVDPMDDATCGTPRRVPVHDTAPKEKVKISVRVTAPNNAVDCKVHWKIVDKSGKQLFPASRPVYFLVHVRG